MLKPGQLERERPILDGLGRHFKLSRNKSRDPHMLTSHAHILYKSEQEVATEFIWHPALPYFIGSRQRSDQPVLRDRHDVALNALTAQIGGYLKSSLLGMYEPPRRHDITIRVPTEPSSQPDPAVFAVTASRAAAARDASILSAYMAEEIICVVSVHAATGPEAAAVALAIVADALKADWKASPSPSR